jgi:hypothetical protein
MRRARSARLRLLSTGAGQAGLSLWTVLASRRATTNTTSVCRPPAKVRAAAHTRVD